MSGVDQESGGNSPAPTHFAQAGEVPHHDNVPRDSLPDFSHGEKSVESFLSGLQYLREAAQCVFYPKTCLAAQAAEILLGGLPLNTDSDYCSVSRSRGFGKGQRATRKTVFEQS
ncbi:hypothetical protein [Paraburkholderia adhaesiva]|uniref:hypothetical protein n=1 Tax=Paraburkholderia adhaesiva TaxID=2883244 RepID=UPI001F34BE91|nr:hypothetical protein [Paraburkholderia adhaesiva]